MQNNVVINLTDEHLQEERVAWKIMTDGGQEIEEKIPEEGEIEVSAKYVGVYMQREGFSIHLKKAAKQIRSSEQMA